MEKTRKPRGAARLWEGLLTLPTPLFDLNDKNPAAGAASRPAELANLAADVMTKLVIPIVFVGIIYSAYILITSQGSPDAYKTVKKNITYLIGGAAIIFFAAYLFNFVVGLFS